jgi:hypothetical protein
VGDEDAIYKHGYSFCRLLLYHEASDTIEIRRGGISHIPAISRYRCRPDLRTIKAPPNSQVRADRRHSSAKQSSYSSKHPIALKDQKSCGGVVAIISKMSLTRGINCLVPEILGRSQVRCSSSLWVPNWRYAQGGPFSFCCWLFFMCCGWLESLSLSRLMV